MTRKAMGQVFILNTVAGFGFATGIYTASLIFVPFIELIAENIMEKRAERKHTDGTVSNPVQMNIITQTDPPSDEDINGSNGSSVND